MTLYNWGAADLGAACVTKDTQYYILMFVSLAMLARARVRTLAIVILLDDGYTHICSQFLFAF